MDWFFIALVAPALYALSNHIDKHLVSAHVETHAISALIIVSCFIGLLFLPIPLLLGAPVFEISLSHILIMLIVGCTSMLALFPYFLALELDDPSVSMPLFQSIPVISYVLAYFVLGEKLSGNELFGSILIILGSVLISFDISSSQLAFKRKIVLLMLLASFLFAVGAVLFKFVAVDYPFLSVMFWEFAGEVLCGCCLVLKKEFREQFLELIQRNTRAVIRLNFINEVLALVATLCIRYAMVLAPVALAQAVLGFQPAFVFFYSVILTILFPKILKENLTRPVLAQKVICIAVICTGAVLIA